MDKSKLTEDQRRFRTNVRSFLLIATLPELQREKALSEERGDKFRAECVQELMDEYEEPNDL